MNIGILGITANPPHNGHLNMILNALNYVDIVWLIPVFKHPFSHKKNITSYEERVEMMHLAFDNIPNVYIKEIEKEYCLENPNNTPYTYNLIKFIKEKNNVDNFTLIFGEDNQETFPKFYNSSLLEQENKILFLPEKIIVHSSNIRNSLLENQNHLSQKVFKYIQERNLYETI